MLISVDERDSRPIYLQIASQIKEQIANGVLRAGAELPSVRELAASLGINFHTVHRAYQVLRDEDVIRLRLGRKATVAEPPKEPVSPDQIEARLARRLDELITEATHLGLTPSDLRALLDSLLQARRQLVERR